MKKPRTKLREKALEEASKLPAEEPDQLAAWILAEVDAEMRWVELFAGSPVRLARLALEAVEEMAANS